MPESVIDLQQTLDDLKGDSDVLNDTVQVGYQDYVKLSEGVPVLQRDAELLLKMSVATRQTLIQSELMGDRSDDLSYQLSHQYIITKRGIDESQEAVFIQQATQKYDELFGTRGYPVEFRQKVIEIMTAYLVGLQEVAYASQSIMDIFNDQS